MAKVKVKFKRLTADAQPPIKKTEGAAAYDLAALEDTIIKNINVQMDAYIIHTGIAVAIPEGYHGKLFLRSSIGAHSKLRLANGTGIIDSDYRGEIMILAENNSRQVCFVEKGQRVAQLIIEKNEDVSFDEVKLLDETKRGKGGIGSTGKGV